MIPIDEKLNLSRSFYSRRDFSIDDESFQAIETKRGICRKILATLALIFAITAGAASTPITSSLKLQSPVLKLAWRNTCMLPYLAIVSIVELRFFHKDF